MAMVDKESTLKVLVVEDDRNFRLILQECLRGIENFKFDKYFASDIQSGVEKFKEVKPDVVLLDICLPDGSGLAVIKSMLQLNPLTGVVIVTGSRLAANVNKAKQNGAIGYILKPYTRKKINEAFSVYLKYRALLKESGQADDIAAAKHAKELTEFFILEDEGDDDYPTKKEEPKAQSPEEVLADWKILFVDSYQTNNENASRHLRKMCKQVDIATSANDFRECVAKNEYQCILMDPTFTSENGYLLANEFKQRYHQARVKPYIIALMPNKDELGSKKWLYAGMNDFILKPCSFKDVSNKLTKFAQIFIEESNDQYLP